MTPADETAAKMETTERELAGAVAGSDDKVDEKIRVSLEDLQLTNHQPRPVQDLHNLLLRISHHLDYQTSERKNIHYRLLAIDGQTKKLLENQTKRRASRAFVRYLAAICIGVAGILAWQAYGETTKQVIATKAPELGWSPEAKQMIASWVEQLGWTKPLADPDITAVRTSVRETPQSAAVAQTAPETVAPKPAVAPALDPEQIQQITQSLAALRQTADQLAAGQDQMAREITKLLAADVEILLKLPAAPPQPPAAAARKPMPVAPPRALIHPR
jgi:hypothetical protein